MIGPARILIALFIVVGLWSCRTRSQGDAQGKVPSGMADIPEVVPIDEEGLRNLIGQRGGKILFLNIWATWCAPCVEEFPDLVRLHEELGGQQVEVVGISADFGDEVQTRIVPFLKNHNVPFRNYVASFKRQEDFINAVEPSWSGALPVSLIYDAEGKKRYFHLGQGSFELFKREIEKSKGGL